MKFYELVKKYSFEQVFAKLVKLFPKEAISINGYRDVYNELSILNPVIDDDYKIIIEKVKGNFDDDSYYRAAVYNEEYEEPRLGFEYERWENVLGWDICDNTLQTIPELDILACVLLEITFEGYNQDEIQNEWQMLNDTILSMNNGELRKFGTLEELLKDLKVNN